MPVGDSREHEHREVMAEQLGDDLVGAGVVDASNASEIHPRDRHVVPRDCALDPLPHHTARRACDEIRVDARHGLLEHRVHVDVLYHCVVDPCSGMMMSTWAPGNGGKPSFKGTSSSHLGTIAMRA